jgi:DNA-binding transcriptional LysR family regulator
MDRLRALEVFVEVVATRRLCARSRSAGHFPRQRHPLYQRPGSASAHAPAEPQLAQDVADLQRRGAVRARQVSILDDVAEAEAIVSSATMQPHGVLRINAPLSFGVLHLAPLWPQSSCRKYPDVQLDVALIDRVVDIVEEGYDMAIRISRSGPAGNVARKLATARNVLCASPAYIAPARHAAAPADLQQHRCIGYSYAATADEWQILDAAGRPSMR